MTATKTPGDDERDVPAGEAGWERYRNSLALLARLLVAESSRNRPWLRGKLSASDLVQQSMLIAHRRWTACRETTESGRLAWMRGILRNVLAEAIRAFGQQMRDAFRERSLQHAEGSSLRLEEWLVAADVSPDEQAMRNEQFLRLGSALAGLPERQRLAVELHHLMGWSLKETAAHLETSEEAAAGLVHRGVVALRKKLTLGTNP